MGNHDDRFSCVTDHIMQTGNQAVMFLIPKYEKDIIGPDQPIFSIKL